MTKHYNLEIINPAGTRQYIFPTTRGTANQLIGTPSSGDLRQLIWVNLSVPAQISNYYVATTGSDTANDGLTAATPFRTIQRAVNEVSQYIVDIDVTIFVADGTYNENIFLKGFTGARTVRIQGNLTTPNNVFVDAVNSGGVFSGVALGTWAICGMRIRNSFGGIAITAFNRCQISIGRLVFNSCAGAVFATTGGVINSDNFNNTTFTFLNSLSGPAFSTSAIGRCTIRASTITFAAGISIPQFLLAETHSAIGFGGMTYSGSFTGQRYVAAQNSMLLTSGQLTTIPGSVAGSVDASSYVG